MSSPKQSRGAHAQRVRWHVVSDLDALHRAALARILEAAHRAIVARSRFLIVLSGGDTPRGVYRMLRKADTDWSRWHVYFGDERCVAANDPERNSQMAAALWLDHVPVPNNQLHAIPAEHGARIAASMYADTLRGLGDFDLVLLGLGEDGHTASLFPGHDCGIAADSPDVLAVSDAPKPPPQRVTLSASRLSRSRAVLFLVAGESKRDALKRWRADADIPARMIRPRDGVDVLLETAALVPSAG